MPDVIFVCFEDAHRGSENGGSGVEKESPLFRVVQEAEACSVITAARSS